MDLLSYAATAIIELKIFGKGIYTAEYEYEFESEYFFPEMEALNFNGTGMIFFEDAQIGINFAELREVKIDGQSYEVQGNRV